MEIFEMTPLFEAVQRSGLFPDSKTFVDRVPRRDPAAILVDYNAACAADAAPDLSVFVAENFAAPEPTPHAADATGTKTGGDALETHLRASWAVLRRDPVLARPGSSLLPLPQPYVVPGGRFDEIYYWDSYFTMLGLEVSGEHALIASMVENFASLIRRYGHVPNGNRSYYLSRSQPPFFALMVELLSAREPTALLRYLPELQAEYDYWMDRSAATRHGVTLADGSMLARYFDAADTPRPESFVEDEELAEPAARPAKGLWRDVRAAAESGWDFSSRWLGDGRSMATIRTTQIVPVDLNCLLVHLERTLAEAFRQRAEPTDAGRATEFAAAAEARSAAINRHCWSARDGFYFDYDLETGRPAPALTLAGMTPLFVGIASSDQAGAVAAVLRAKFLRPGGLVTTLAHTGQQWDAPNGWAPLQWMAVAGLERYGHGGLAAEVARRWLRLNEQVYRRTGKMMEKYDVTDLDRLAGGGEYPTQDGFGWTNGVWLRLWQDYGRAG